MKSATGMATSCSASVTFSDTRRSLRSRFRSSSLAVSICPSCFVALPRTRVKCDSATVAPASTRVATTEATKATHATSTKRTPPAESKVRGLLRLFEGDRTLLVRYLQRSPLRPQPTQEFLKASTVQGSVSLFVLFQDK